MRVFPRNPAVFAASFLVKMLVFAASAQNPEPALPAVPHVTQWSTAGVEHVYGLMEAKAHARGSLILTTDALSFEGKNAHVLIPRSRLRSISTGHDRVELFGITGQILRMAIPDGGGLAAAALMHHRVDMLTVQYVDAKGGDHAAVFYLPAAEAGPAIAAFGMPIVPLAREAAVVCQGAPEEPGSVLVTTSGWEDSQVPAAYRALVYEHVIERLRKSKSVSYVYRSGESGRGGVCAQHVITLTLNGFRPGNQVKRSALGPVGMFVGTTQMSASVRITDEGRNLNSVEEIKSSVRDQSESIAVADKIAKTVTKRYESAVAHSNVVVPRSTGEGGGSLPQQPAEAIE
jgi:stress response protein YsnF